MHKLIIPGRLVGLNDYILAERTDRHKAAKLKREQQEIILWAAKAQLRGVRFAGPVRMHYLWVERDRRRDLDNIAAARKFVQDALVCAKILKNDGWAYVAGFSDDFDVDPCRPRIEITFEEVRAR